MAASFKVVSSSSFIYPTVDVMFTEFDSVVKQTNTRKEKYENTKFFY
jgi:hypothetical protein